jgi:hypothetical protein
MSGIKAWFKKLGIYGYLLIAIAIIVAAYFIIVHQAHLAAYSTTIFIVVFIGLHFVMHIGGHGSHGGHSKESQEENEQHQHGESTQERRD